MVHIGIQEIDDQHSELARVMGDIARAVASGADVSALLSEFEALAQIHFACEEHEMDRSGYPYLDQHAVAHRWVLSDLATFRVVPWKIGLVVDSILRHIDLHDAAWAEWLAGKRNE